MKVLRLIPLALVLAACSSVNVPLSPYRIDVQQGNALEQESVEKLKLGLNRSQVRFLLGTPLLVDPFRGNRWDYVYNFRKAGKLTEERRLALFFDGDVLVRIEAEGMTLKSGQPEAKPADAVKPQAQRVDQPKAAVTEPDPVAVASPMAAPVPVQSLPVADSKPAVSQAEPAPTQVAPMANAQPAVVAPIETPAKPAEPTPARAAPAKDSESSLSETSIVQPLGADSQAAASRSKPVAVSSAPSEPLALQAESNVEAIKPDIMPAYPNASPANSGNDRVIGALNAWAEAWRTRNEQAFLAAYAPSFRPEGGQTREEWEKSRRLLLGASGSVDLKIDGVDANAATADLVQVTFRQFYRSDSFQEAVVKLMSFVRVDNRWLIQEEKVLAPIKADK